MKLFICNHMLPTIRTMSPCVHCNQISSNALIVSRIILLSAHFWQLNQKSTQTSEQELSTRYGDYKFFFSFDIRNDMHALSKSGKDWFSQVLNMAQGGGNRFYESLWNHGEKTLKIEWLILTVFWSVIHLKYLKEPAVTMALIIIVPQETLFRV